MIYKKGLKKTQSIKKRTIKTQLTKKRTKKNKNYNNISKLSIFNNINIPKYSQISQILSKVDTKILSKRNPIYKLCLSACMMSRLSYENNKHFIKGINLIDKSIKEFNENTKTSQLIDKIDNTYISDKIKFYKSVKTYNDCNVSICIIFNRLWIIFRGTASFYNISSDLKLLYTTSNLIKGKVHKGFWKLYKEMRDILFEIFNEIYIELNTIKNIIFTGQSLGGALSTLCIVDFLQNYKFPKSFNKRKIYNITFGSPRVGNKEFATNAINLIKPSNIKRFANKYDIITALPPSLFYKHISSSLSGGNNTFNSLLAHASYLKINYMPVVKKYFIKEHKKIKTKWTYSICNKINNNMLITKYFTSSHKLINRIRIQIASPDSMISQRIYNTN